MVVFFIPDDGACPVHLLCKDQAHQLVREDQRG